MTNTPNFTPTAAHPQGTPANSLPNGRAGSTGEPRRVLFVVYPGVCILDMAGPQTSFLSATHHLAADGLPGYEGHTASIGGGPVHTLEGVVLHTEALEDFDPAAIDTIVVPGTPHILAACAAAGPLLAWLRQAGTVARRVTSVCNGAFLLAGAGLLDGKRAATHWLMCDQLQSLHPAVQVDSDAIFVRQGNVWTSAGVTAGIDLALALIEDDSSHAIALRVARELVVFLKRPGGQAQFSTLLSLQSRDGGTFDALHLWIVDHLAEADLGVERLARQASMSPRNFTRVYKDRTGRTPAAAVQLFRLEAARRMLEDSDRHIEQVARLCGFGGEERMRLAFQRNLGVSPHAYRSRFSRTPDSA